MPCVSSFPTDHVQHTYQNAGVDPETVQSSQPQWLDSGFEYDDGEGEWTWVSLVASGVATSLRRERLIKSAHMIIGDPLVALKEKDPKQSVNYKSFNARIFLHKFI